MILRVLNILPSAKPEGLQILKVCNFCRQCMKRATNGKQFLAMALQAKLSCIWTLPEILRAVGGISRNKESVTLTHRRRFYRDSPLPPRIVKPLLTIFRSAQYGASWGRFELWQRQYCGTCQFCRRVSPCLFEIQKWKRLLFRVILQSSNQSNNSYEL